LEKALVFLLAHRGNKGEMEDGICEKNVGNGN